MFLQIVGIVAIIALTAMLVLRPSGIVPVILAFAVVVAAIVVSWRDVEQYRQERAASSEFQQRSTTASTTAPTPAFPRGG
jgi:uncharacterized membrane protein (GlpM family)